MGGKAVGAPTNQTSRNLVNSLVAGVNSLVARGKVIQRHGRQRGTGGDGVGETVIDLRRDDQTTVRGDMRIFQYRI